jgi:hypothetical protein
MAGYSSTTGRNQVEDQECAVRDLLAWGALGIGGTAIQSAVKGEVLAIAVLQPAFVKATESQFNV